MRTTSQILQVGDLIQAKELQISPYDLWEFEVTQLRRNYETQAIWRARKFAPRLECLTACPQELLVRKSLTLIQQSLLQYAPNSSVRSVRSLEYLKPAVVGQAIAVIATVGCRSLESPKSTCLTLQVQLALHGGGTLLRYEMCASIAVPKRRLKLIAGTQALAA